MEDRRRYDDKNWDEIKEYIKGSIAYRAKDELTQKYQAEKLASLDTRVMIQNGRIVKIEEWKEIIEAKIKQRKDNYATGMAWITIIATIVMAVSAFVTVWITFFKK